MDDLDQDFAKEKYRLPHSGLPIKGLILTGILLAIIVATRHPFGGGPQVILLFLAILFLVFVNLFAIILQLVWILRRSEGYSWVRLLYCSITLAFGAVFLIGLQTLGQLRIIDTVLVGVFEVVLLFYIIRRF